MPGSTVEYGSTPDNALHAVIAEITQLCFTPEVLRRYQLLSELQPDYVTNYWITQDAKGRSAEVELGVINCGTGLEQHTYIDNFEHVGHGTKIGVGAQIGAYCFIGNRVTIEEGAELDTSCRIEAGAHVARYVIAQEGSSVLTGASVGANSILQKGSEVGYDVTLPENTVTKAGSFTTPTGRPEEPLAMNPK